MRPVHDQFPVTLGYRQPARFDPGYVHRGIDYATPIGTPVRATIAGDVIHAGPHGALGYGPAYGIQVVIRTGDVWHLYAHLDAVAVRAGDRVETGQLLAWSGDTGNTRGAHLHYQENTRPPAHYRTDRKPQFIDHQEEPTMKAADRTMLTAIYNLLRARTAKDGGGIIVRKLDIIAAKVDQLAVRVGRIEQELKR